MLSAFAAVVAALLASSGLGAGAGGTDGDVSRDAAPVRFAVGDDSFSTGRDTARLKTLHDTKTGSFASVIYSHGGSVEDLLLPRAPSAGGGVKRVLWAHNRNATAVALNADWRGRMLIPYGNRIGGAKYTFNGTTYHLPVNDVAGLNNSLHGLLWNRSMSVVSATATDASAVVVLRYDFDGTDRGYPFLLRVDIAYTLSPEGFSFAVTASNRNPDGWPLPFYNGWHPYFLCDDASSAVVTLDPCTPWLLVETATGPQFPPPRHSNMVPTGRTQPFSRFNGTRPVGGNASTPSYFDVEGKAATACPGANGVAYTTTMHDPASGDTVRIDSDGFPFVQVWTGAKTTFGIDAVVLEPLSAQSDAYNNHDTLHVISPGQTFVSSVHVSLA